MYIESNERRLSPEEAVKAVREKLLAKAAAKPSLVVILMRTAFFIAILAFCVTYAYQYVAIKETGMKEWLGAVFLTMAAVETWVSEKCEESGFYKTKDPSILYSFFMISVFFMAVAIGIGLPLYATVFAVVAALIGVMVILRGLDLFDPYS